MRILIPATIFLTLATSSADEFLENYDALKKAGDPAAIEKFLETSATAEADNPDYYATAGNYWWGVSQSVAITPIKEGDYTVDPKDLSITDPKTGKKVGSIGKAADAMPELSERALEILSQGAKKFPERADIALGLAHVQKKSGFREGYVDTLTALLAHAKKQPDSLKWMKNGDLPEPAATFLPETVQNYSAALFNANTPATDKLCAKLLEAVTKTYPDHPYAYNLKAALADATGKPEEALKMLGIAHQKAPKDPLILSNLAGAYAKQGNKTEAITAYEKLLKMKVDPRSHQKTEAALKKLKNTVRGELPGQ